MRKREVGGRIIGVGSCGWLVGVFRGIGGRFLEMGYRVCFVSWFDYLGEVG